MSPRIAAPAAAQAAAIAALRRVAFGDGGYGAPARGTPASLAAVTREEIAARLALHEASLLVPSYSVETLDV